MKTIALASWADFKRESAALLNDRRNRVMESERRLLFRGQPDSSLPLETTLEREGLRDMSVRSYHAVVSTAHEYLGNVIRPLWPIERELNLTEPMYDLGLGESYRFYGYLRHHGFPSPLLDWSQSPYVAAFFAFKKKPERSDEVAIFVFGNTFDADLARAAEIGKVQPLGPWAAIDRRHVLQQSCYSLCWRRVGEGRYSYFSHETVAAKDDAAANEKGYLLLKFTLPWSERSNVLEDLQAMNINEYTLFGSEDALVATVASDVFRRSRL